MYESFGVVSHIKRNVGNAKNRIYLADLTKAFIYNNVLQETFWG